MSDTVPNPQLEIMRLRCAISQQEQASDNCLMTIMEAIDRIRTAQKNREAHLRAIADYRKKLEGYTQQHGDFGASDVLKLASTIT